MSIYRYCFPERDLTVFVVREKHTSEQIIQAYRELDSTCATRWLVYLDPTTDMSKVDIAHIPAIRRARHEKRKELFGENPKLFAIVCASEESEQYFFKFWQEYTNVNEGIFNNLGEAYDWLGLDEAARAAVAHAIAAAARHDDRPDAQSRPLPTHVS